MSLPQKRPTNPAKFYLKVKSGSIIYYDKEVQENINVPTPFEFIVLDQLATVRGWSDQDKSGYWSNEVRNVGRDTLTVRTNRGIKEAGLWRDIKGSVGIAGAKYHSSIYVAHQSRDGLVISNLSLTGAALKAWIKFTQKHRLNNVKVVLSGWSDDKKGSVSYKVPVFEAVPMGEEEKNEGVELDKQLQAYFSEYFNYVPEEEVHGGFEGKGLVVEPANDDNANEPINLDDIPF